MSILKIHSFKLVQNGLMGIKAEVDYQRVNKKGDTVIDYVKENHRPLPIPSYLEEALVSLKYYFLVTTGHWDEDWDQYLRSDRRPVDAGSDFSEFGDYKKVMSLMDSTFVTAVKCNGSVISLKGEIKTVGYKCIKVTSPNILEEDNDDINGLFDEMLEKVNKALEAAKSYLASSKGDLMNSREFLMKMEKSPERKAALQEYNKKECDEMMMEYLSKKGYLIMKDSEMEILEDDGSEALSLIESIKEEELVHA